MLFSRLRNLLLLQQPQTIRKIQHRNLKKAKCFYICAYNWSLNNQKLKDVSKYSTNISPSYPHRYPLRVPHEADRRNRSSHCAPGSEVTPPPSLHSTEPSNPAISPAGSKPGRISHCEPFESFIKVGLDARLSAQRIYQDLGSEQQFAGG
jgi:hypothetical protein